MRRRVAELQNATGRIRACVKDGVKRRLHDQMCPEQLTLCDELPNVARRVHDVGRVEVTREPIDVFQREVVPQPEQTMPVAEEAPLEITEEQFISRETQDFIQGYRSQAIAGLGIVGGNEARSALERIARDQASPLHGSAEQALRKITDSQPRSR